MTPLLDPSLRAVSYLPGETYEENASNASRVCNPVVGIWPHQGIDAEIAINSKTKSFALFDLKGAPNEI